MPNRIAILHYAGPPIVGGVESTIAHHAHELANLGYSVRVISGFGETFDERVEIHIDPIFGSRDPQVLAAKSELDGGVVSNAFHSLVELQEAALKRALENCDVCIVHNVHTLNKNLALTAALHRLHQLHVIAWCHDLAWTNSQYLPELHDGYPWNLLRQAWANTRYVTVSESRRIDLAQLINITPDDISVIPPGIDPATFFQWTATTCMMEEKLQLLNADILLLVPARLTRRKNVELALRVLYELRKQNGKDYRLIISGPPGPHNPTNPGYLGDLLELRNALGLQSAAHFLYELSEPPLVPDDATMANLFQLCDALFFPSLQEGFGIPILEAGLAGLPIFCSNLPPFHETGQEDVVFFDPIAHTAEEIALMIRTYFTGNPRQRMKARVRQNYRWDALVRTRIVPLLEGS